MAERQKGLHRLHLAARDRGGGKYQRAEKNLSTVPTELERKKNKKGKGSNHAAAQSLAVFPLI